MKKGQVSVFILVGLFFVAALVLLAWLSSKNVAVEPKECAVPADCVPTECCDSDLCVPKGEAPEDCSRIACKLGCENYIDNSTGCEDPFTPDVEKGFCDCVDQKCKPVWP
ncbi:MAG: hypothetical protein ABH864_06110 [archaeon]